MIASQWFESGANSESDLVKEGGDARLYSVRSDVRLFEKTASTISIISFCASVVNYVAGENTRLEFCNFEQWERLVTCATYLTLR